MRSLTLEEIHATYADPTSYIQGDGTVSKAWEMRILTSFRLPAPLPLSWNPSLKVDRIKCHFAVAPTLEQIFKDLHTLPGVWASLNDYGGCYAWRPQRKSSKLSLHCWGIAIDLDVADNPFGSEPKMNPEVVSTFAKYNWRWGGTFKPPRQDGMHFEVGIV